MGVAGSTGGGAAAQASGGGGMGAVGSAGGGGGVQASGGGAVGGGGAAALNPQFPQNAEFGANGDPQFGHALTFVIVTEAKETSEGVSAVPQSLQKVDPSRFAIPQRGQVAIGVLSISTSR